MTDWNYNRNVLNSAVITAPGEYEYRTIRSAEAIEWLRYGDFTSAIGYQETAEAFSNLLGVEIPVNRQQIYMRENDEALVLRLLKRIDPMKKGELTPDWVLYNSEIGLLRRKSVHQGWVD